MASSATNTLQRRRPRQRCVRCGGSSWLPIAYGYPGPEMMEAAEQGKIELGGCVLEVDAPVRRCRRCGQLPGRPMEWTGIDGPRRGEFSDRHQVLVSSAVPPAEAGEWELIVFALSFDGYAAFGSAGVAELAQRTRRAFEKRGTLSDNLVVLRACLFFEQRIARANDATLHTPYIAALLEAIRAGSRALEEPS